MNLIRSQNASLGAHGFTIPAWDAKTSQLHYQYRRGTLTHRVSFPHESDIQPYQGGAYDCIMREFHINDSLDQTLAQMDSLGYELAVLPELDFFDRQFGTKPDQLRTALGAPVAIQGRHVWYAASCLAHLGESSPKPLVTLVTWRSVKTGRREYLGDSRQYTILGVNRLG